MPGIALKGAHLSLQQERLWSFQQGNKTYRVQCLVAINGKLDFQAFEQALQQIVQQHTIFQTVFYALPGMDIPVQVLGHPVDLCCPIIDLERMAAPEQSAALEMQLKSFQEDVFDLEHGPLVRVVLFRLSAEKTQLLISLPALYADAATLPLLINELVKRYTANLLGQEVNEEPLQYTVVSAWQKQQMSTESEEAKLAYDFWKKFDLTQLLQLRRKLEKVGIVESDKLHTRQNADFTPRTLPVTIDDILSARLHALASHYNVSVATVLLLGWLIVLRRLIDEPQLVIGIACDGRNYEELADAPGLYTRSAPFSTFLQDSWSFEQLLAFADPLLEITKQYQTYFSWSDALNETYDHTSQTYFPIAFEQEHWPDSFVGPNINIQFEQRSYCTEPFVLKLGALQVGEQVFVELHYDAHSVSNEHVGHLASMLQTLLNSIVEQPQSQIGTLSLLSSVERRQLLTAFQAPKRSWPIQGLHQLFEEQVQRFPQQLAVISTQEQLSYQELNERANQLAQVLLYYGVGPDVLVGICLPRQAHMLVVMLGILKAGGAYLPLDIGSPAARVSYQLQQSRATLLLTQENFLSQLPVWKGKTLCLEALSQELAQASTQNQPVASTGENLAYVIYTSGSTGVPKGVMISQRNVVNYTQALCEQLGVAAGWQYATVSTLAADLGNTAIFCALASGGCVQMLDYETITSGDALANWTQIHPIDVLKIVPSHLSALLESERAKELLPRRELVLGGEVLSGQLVERVLKLGGTCQIYNHYGPTETTIGVLVNAIGAQSSEDALVALGRPIVNTQVYVLDHHLQLVPPGVIGELYIGGAGVARGYIDAPEQTAERFVPHPYSNVGGERLYRSGDLVRYGKGEQLEFVGRRDGQVKLRGYRIEVGEIEVVLRQHPQIRDCVVMLREDRSGDPQLVGYVVPKKLPVPEGMNIREFMREYLPDYMLPAVFMYLKFLPLTANGKVDRALLVADSGEGSLDEIALIDTSSTSRKIMQPRDGVEMKLLRIWEEVLQLQPISVLDNFFDIGGHSLLAVRLMSHIAEKFGRSLDLTILFQHPTVAELAIVLRQQNTPEEEPLLAAIQTQGSRPPFFCVHPAGGTAFRYVNLARRLGTDQPFYGLHAPFGAGFGSDENIMGETVEEVATHYIAAIQTVQPQGPYLLGGWSLGGVIAFEMAQQLQKQGHEIGVLAIIDSAISDAQRRAKALAEVIDLGDTGIVKDFTRAAGLVVPDDFDQRTLDEQLDYVVNQAREKHFIPADASIDFVRIFTRIRIKTKHIAHIYAGDSYSGKFDYFLSGSPAESIEDFDEGEDGDRSEDLAEHIDEPVYLQPWRELAQGGFEVHRIPGSHLDMMEEPNVQVLAEALKLCIDKVCDQQRV